MNFAAPSLARSCLLAEIVFAGALLVPSDGQADCVFNLLPPPEPYYEFGILITLQSHLIAVGDCDLSVEEMKAAVEAASPQRRAGSGAHFTFRADQNSDLGNLFSANGRKFKNCDDAKSRGFAFFRRSDPDAADDHNRDGDGVACE